jgi:hypothetical protein
VAGASEPVSEAKERMEFSSMKFVESSISVSSRSEMAGMVVVISNKYRGQVLWNMSISGRAQSGK